MIFKGNKLKLLVAAESRSEQEGAGLGAGRGRRGQGPTGSHVQVEEHVFYPTDKQGLYVCMEECLYAFFT